VRKSETLRLSQVQPDHEALRFSNQSNAYSAVQALNNTPPSKSRVKEIISTTQNTFDKLKRDLVEKEQVIEDKNREIMKLRMTNEELAQKFNLAAGRQF
jgi:arsenate reductase-like glutaredoxin family protein